MRNRFSPTLRHGCIAWFAWILTLAASHSLFGSTVGSTVHDVQGQTIGTIASDLNIDGNLSPSIVIRRQDGSLLITPANRLSPAGSGYQLTPAPQGGNQDDASIEAIFEIRSMTMVIMMQDHRDAGLISNISDLIYEVHGDKLHLRGSISSQEGLERLIATTNDLCDYEIAAEITIPPAA